MGGRIASPTFIGRVEELELLEAARRRAADGEPAVVLVGGEAGVGKTRLIAELAARGITDGNRVLAGGCMPVGDGALPYAPIVEVLRSLVSEVGAGTVRELVGPSWPELARLLPALGEPRGDAPGQAAQARLFELLLALLGRLGEQALLVLVVEDLHWADQSTRELVAFLVRNLRRERVQVVVTYRDDEPAQQRLGPYLAELNRAGRVERVELARLDQIETAAQLAGILGTAPPAELAEAVFARSEGNPFFTEELLASVRGGSAELPATLRDLLRGRLDALPGSGQQLVRVAAVAGRQVSHELLVAVAGLDEPRLDGALRAAVAYQLLVIRSDGYAFRHALLQEVAYASLLPGERVGLHARYARALTERAALAGGSPAVAAAELASHWDAAQRPTEALVAYVAAGLAAEHARAFPEADRHYQRALQLWTLVSEPGSPGGLDYPGLLARAAEAAALAGGTTRAVALLEDALSRIDETAEPVRAATLLGRLGVLHRYRARGDTEALAAYEAAEALLADQPPSAEHARVLGGHARTLMVSLRPQQAIPLCEQAIATARAVGARAEEAYALEILAGCMDDLGELDRAIALHLEARQLAEEVGDADTVVRTYLNLGYSLSLAGRDRDALVNCQAGYQRARELGLERAGGSFVAGGLARQLLSSGRWDECEQLVNRVLASEVWFVFGLHAIHGRLLLRRGDFPAAQVQLALALRLSPPAAADDAQLGLAELAVWKGDHDAAAAAIADGLRWCADNDPDGVFHHRSSPWLSLALRLEADRAEQAAARRAPNQVVAARRRAAPVVAELDRLAAQQSPQARFPEVVCNMLLAQAERFRLHGASDPERWQTACVAWEQLERPFEAAYAHFRHAESLLATGAPRSQAEATLRPAHQMAATLGAAPLRQEIELLAGRGRLRLTEPTGPPAVPTPTPSPMASLGLTRRETEVLSLVAEGRTNRQIGQALFITPKTAGVHVSRILAKLGVTGRGEAAAIAHRLGLDRQ